jgi:glutamate racemase
MLESEELHSGPIGIFDSGVGGLSVLREIRSQLPYENLIFLADQAHVPYGPRSLHQVRDFSETITRFLLDQGAKLIVVACNTASAAALYHLRETFPEIPFVGMEPAVKPAAEQTESGVVGVLATPATFQGELYASVVERFANGVTVLQDTCSGLVGQIEKGALDLPVTREILERALAPMLENGIDRVVMGCTHYPFVIPLIEEIVGPQVEVIDPAPAVARQVGRVLNQRGLLNIAATPGQVQYLTSGNAAKFSELLGALLREKSPVGRVNWQSRGLRVEPQDGDLDPSAFI